MQVNFAPGMTEATLRVIELHEENELPVLEPDKVELAGTIGSVHEFLLKRISEKEQINQKRCYILVDREKMTLKLVTNETDSRNKATVRGELKYYPKFLEFGTAGLRGVIGAGTNRMNVYTVRKATQGLANYIIWKLYSRKLFIFY